ncbi:cinnamoyl-CoA reductase 1-like isoform X2 [Wolffia australiana]
MRKIFVSLKQTCNETWPNNPKNAHLRKLEHAENLRLFKADVLDYESLSAAIAGCEGVFHVASPVVLEACHDPQVELIQPTVDGTINVLKACSEGVRRVVLVSSCATAVANPAWPFDKIMDENCYSDKVFCEEREYWYFISKILSEERAVEYCKSNGLDLVVVCPSLVVGPLLQQTVNQTSEHLIEFLKGRRKLPMTLHVQHLVDARDVSDALLLVYESPEARGRYICNSFSIATWEFCDKLRKLYPNFSYPKLNDKEKPYHILGSEKLMQLGWKQMPFEKSIRDTVEDFLSKGFLTHN